MPLTKDFRLTVKERAERDPAFKAALYEEAAQAILEGDLPTAKSLLRDFINATVGFPWLAEAMKVSDKSLMRMFGPTGNPRADNLFAALAHVRDGARLAVTVKAKPTRSAPPRRAEPRHHRAHRSRTAEPALA
jgi:hypothetical protein